MSCEQSAMGPWLRATIFKYYLLVNLMQKTILTAFILILFISAAFAEVEWEYHADAGISLKPIVSGNKIFIASQDGILHAVSLNTGKMLWKRAIGKFVLQPILFQSNIIVANNNGTIAKIKQDGTVESQLNIPSINSKVTTIYGIDSATNKIYLTTDGGVFTLEENNVSSFFNATSSKTYTSPTVSGSKIVFGAGDELIVLNTNKQVAWRKKVAEFWTSKPIVDGSVIYIGALDNAIYAFDLDDGNLLWRYETDGWVASTPYIEGSTVYVGSNDGYVYAISNGYLQWKAKTDQAVQTMPISGSFAGRDALFVGSSDGKLYAVEKNTGKILWRFLAGDWVASPAISVDKIIVGSRNGIVYSIKTERGCTINEPEEKSTVGQKEVRLKGIALSNSGSPSVSVRIGNDGPWKSASVSGDEWKLKLDPSEMRAGPNRIFCKVSDAGGEESEPYYSTILLKNPSIPKSKLIVTAPKSVNANKLFVISVNDGDDNSPVEEFKIIYEGKEEIATGNITLNITKEGKFSGNITKTGFEDTSVQLDIKVPNPLVDMAVPTIGGLLLLAILYFFLVRRLFRR